MPTEIHQPTGRTRPALEAIEAWRPVATSIVADLVAGRTLVDPLIRPLRPAGSGVKLLGPAITARCDGADYGAVHHAIAEAQPGDVLVLAVGGRLSHAVIGDLLGGAARRKGLAGVVVDGAVRDTEILAGFSDFLVFARGTTPLGPSSKDGGAVNVPVSFGGVDVAPYDLVLGDADGLVIIRPGDALDLLTKSQARLRAEIGWEEELATGRSTLDVFGIPAARRL